MTPDVLVVGGGVAGSTLAILLGRAGLKVDLYERDEFPREKPCGEGLMPAGVAVLGRLGLLGAVGGVPFRGVRYHHGDQVATGPFPTTKVMPSAGLAQRRAVLDRVLFEAAAATAGVRAHTRAAVERPLLERGRVTGVRVAGVARRAGLVVAADGAHSPLRRALGLDAPRRRTRFGMRAHFRLAPGSAAPPWVDIFLGEGHELYVTALPRGELMVAALAESRGAGAPAEALFERWWRAQPLLAERLRGARRISRLRGAAPLGLRATRGFVPGMVLLGDAAGSLDPITGCGMSQALVSAELLAGFAARGDASPDDWIAPFDRARRERLRDSSLLSGSVLWLARHPRFVSPVLRSLRAWPDLFSHLVGVAGLARSLCSFGAAICCAGLLLFARPAGAAAVPVGKTDSSTVALLAAGDSSLARLDLAAATSCYVRAHRATPNSYEADWKLARALADQATLSAKAADQERLCGEAASMARAAIALEPRDSKGHAFLAIALGKLAIFAGGKRKVALAREIKAEADTALALDPNDDLAHHVLGVWNREVAELSGFLRFFAERFYGRLPKGSVDAALDHLGKACALRTNAIPHQVELGITLASARRYREARQELERALRMPTSWVTDDYYRAKARAALANGRLRAR